MKMRRGFPCAAACAAASLLACQALADVVAYDNFGPGNDFDDGRGWILIGPNVGTYWAQGFEFTSQASGDVTRIDMPLWHQQGPNEFTLRLYNQGLDQILGEWDVQGQPGLPTPVSEFSADGSVQIEDGQTYWLIAFPGDNTRGDWRQNNTGAESMRARDNFGTWQFFGPSNQGAFRVVVEDAPDCPPDWNGDGVVDSDDLFDFLSDWAAGNADYNGDGVTDSDDLFDFLSDWANPGQFPGC